MIFRIIVIDRFIYRVIDIVIRKVIDIVIDTIIDRVIKETELKTAPLEYGYKHSTHSPEALVHLELEYSDSKLSYQISSPETNVNM